MCSASSPRLKAEASTLLIGESGGNWHINTGNGYEGCLQIYAGTWRDFNGETFAPRADLASREQQIVVGERILAAQGWGAWPACSAQLGFR